MKRVLSFALSLVMLMSITGGLALRRMQGIPIMKQRIMTTIPLRIMCR